MSVSLTAFCFLAVGMTLVTGACEPDKDLPKVEVWLSESITSVRGREWPQFEDGTYAEIAGDTDDCRITIHLSGGKSYSTITTTLFMAEEQGKVGHVSITPRPHLSPYRLGKVITFHQAITELERLAKEFGIENHPDLREEFARWKKQNPESGPWADDRKMRIMIDDSVSLWMRISSDVRGDGWFTALDFYAVEFYK